MPTQTNLEVQAGNHETVRLQVTSLNGTPVALTGRELEFVVKRHTSDDDAASFVRVTRALGSEGPVSSGQPIRVVDEGVGRIEVDLIIGRHGTYAWRLDVITSGNRSTAMNGRMEVTPV